MLRSTVIVSAAMMFAGVDPVLGCFAISGHPQSWVRDADVIVRVRALEASSVASDSVAAPGTSALVRFEILEVLKGGEGLFTLSVPGTLGGGSDFNDRTVPYGIVRPGGRGGGCFARNYETGGEYLLLLNRSEGQLTPYWVPLAATNEQVRGADDPWVVWVRSELSGQRSRLPNTPLQPASGASGPGRTGATVSAARG